MAAHRWWKIEVTDSGRRFIYEIEMRESVGGADVTTSGGDTTGSDATSPGNAVDNDTGTAWTTNDTGNSWNLIYDFQSGTEKDIKEVAFYLNSFPIGNFNVYYSDNEVDWTLVATKSITFTGAGWYEVVIDDNYVVLSEEALSIIDGSLTIYPISILINNDTLSITDSSLTVLQNMPVTVTISNDTLSIAEGNLGILTVQTIGLNGSSLVITDGSITVSGTYAKQLTDILNVLDVPSKELNIYKVITSNIDVILTALEEYILYITDDLDISDVLTSQSIGSISVEDILNTNDLIRISFLIAALDTIDVLDTNTFLKEGYAAIDESILANLEKLTNLIGVTTITDAVDVQDFIEKPFVELLLEAIDVSSTLLPKLITAALQSEGFEINDVLVKLRLLSLTNEDNIEVLSTLESSGILGVILSDYITFTLIDDDGNDSTYYGWTYNPENHAVTNYALNFSELTNYQDKTYLANSTGLYLLDGNQDAGSYIQSTITTAGLTFGHRTEKQIPQVFLGIGGNHHIVTVSVDERTTAYYEMKGNLDDGLITKTLKPGKGLIGNTWQFTLVDVNQLDFDLDSLEFFPIFLGRKHRK